jgi:serine/threonine-protein kinase
VALFRKEARVLTHIAHPAIVQYRVFARDPQLDLHYIVTDFINGEPITRYLDRERSSLSDVVVLARRLASGLEAAHDHGAIHRDMSPDNILLPDGRIDRAKIIDFGIAKSLDLSAETVVGEGFAGKLGYVAPEQFGDFGRQIGPWTDVYSTALVLLAFARGKAPAMGTTLSDAVERRRVPVDLSDLPVPIAPLIERMLVPEPTGRIRSMREVLVALDGIRIAADQPLARGKAEPRSGSLKEVHAPRVKPPEPAETTYAPARARGPACRAGRNAIEPQALAEQGPLRRARKDRAWATPDPRDHGRPRHPVFRCAAVQACAGGSGCSAERRS